MKKLKRISFWIIANAIFVFLGYKGELLRDRWAHNLWIFWFWLVVLSEPTAFFIKEIRVQRYKDGPSVPSQIDNILGIAITAALATMGHFVLAAFWVLRTGSSYAIYTEEPKK